MPMVRLLRDPQKVEDIDLGDDSDHHEYAASQFVYRFIRVEDPGDTTFVQVLHPDGWHTYRVVALRSNVLYTEDVDEKEALAEIQEMAKHLPN